MSNRRADAAKVVKARIRGVLPDPVVKVVHRARARRHAGSPADQRRTQALAGMYEQLRKAYEVKAPPSRGGLLPEVGHIREVEEAALHGVDVYAEFFWSIRRDADIDTAFITWYRRALTVVKMPARARSVAQAFQQIDQLRPIADLCLAVSALREPVPISSWQLFTRNDLAFVLKHAPIEYFRTAIEFAFGPDDAAAAMDKVASGEVAMAADAETWLEVALLLFSGGFETQSSYATGRAAEALELVEDEGHRNWLRGRIDTLRSWHGRAERAGDAPAPADGEVSVALVDYEHPDARKHSDYAIDQIETATVLGHLARHSGARFAGSDDVVAEANGLQRRSPAPVAGPQVPVRLMTMQRDLSEFAALPENTWAVVTDWFANPLEVARGDLPFHPNLRPVFVSFHITEPALGRPGVVDYLRAHGPIGCRDRETMQLLQAARVPVFFSGAITSTSGDVIAVDTPTEPRTEVVYFDLPATSGTRRSVIWGAIRGRSLAANLHESGSALNMWRGTIAKAVTPDVRLLLALRSLGVDTEFRNEDRGSGVAADLGALSDDAFTAMRTGLDDKLAVLFGAILAGRSADEVYAAWRETCASDVAEAEALRTSFPDLGTVDFDLQALCDRVRANSVVVERTQQVGEGAELNVEFSLDANYKPKLDVVLDSLVAHTDRPVRAFVLCRQHGPEDFERMARLFPMVSFMWIPTDDVDYGPIAGKVPWASFATMDRTLLPLILPDVDRMMHLDLDLLILGDLADLYDTPFDGHRMVAIPEPQQCYISGYDTVRRTAHRLRSVGTPELAVELLGRVAERHAFDFEVFNAGVMVMNLDKMREEEFCARFLPYVQRYGVNGQEVLNIYVGNDYARRDRRWNLNARLEFTEDTRVAHWAGPYKPWRKDWYIAGRDWWDAAEARFLARTAALTEREREPSVG
ncbi:MAG TPA: glycosyltransferase [Jatrophihabitans sp.]